jgi:hypothetical protein
MFAFRRSGLLALVALAVVGATSSAVLAQTKTAPYRKLAPGVERTIQVELDPRDTVSQHPIMEIMAIPDLKWTPKTRPAASTLYNKAKSVTFERSITGLDLSFKPLRMIYVDIPQPNGKLQRKLIWYMVYRVTNRVGILQPENKADGTIEVKELPPADYLFLPMFSLYSHEEKKEYLDQVIPVAIGPIQEREDPNRKLLTTVEMSKTPIPPSTAGADRSVWGVVTWEDIDPEIDFLSIYVGGLTNAYKWTDNPAGYKVGDSLGKGRKFVYQTLMVNFWRPGDQYLPTENEIRYGTPAGMAEKYGVPAGLDYTWVYR